MANLVVEHHARPGTTLVDDGTLSIGRGADNDIVLDHPTVSRHHAIIERVAGEYFITDLKSRNGTRVNARTVRERQTVANGAKIRFGQVRVTFVVHDDATSTATLERTPGGPALEPGILFDCLCGTRLWAKQEAAGGLVECGKCERQVVVPEESSKVDSGETVSGMVFAPAQEELAAPVQTGTCSICQWHMTSEEQITTCPSCGLTFHAACWEENCGCSAYGCAQVNAHAPAPKPPSTRPAVPPPLSEPTPEQVEVPNVARPLDEQKQDAEPRFVAGHALLGASVMGGVLGLLAFGTLALAVLVTCLVFIDRRGPHGSERKLMIAAAALSLVGTIAGVAVSCAWWLGVKL